MDINNNQQVNTFVKGMNTDVSDALMDSSQYRYAENVRLVTNTDSNSGELRLVDGTVSVDGGDLWDKIITMTSIRNKVIVIARTINEWKDSCISIYTNDYNNGFGEWKKIVSNLPYYDFVQEGETEPHFSLTTRWESDENIKLYIADGIHNIISLNITKSYLREDNDDNTIEDVIPYATAALDAPVVTIIKGGRLKSARVQYGFRLYNIGQAATQVSPLSRIQSIYKNDSEGYKPEEITDRAARIKMAYRDSQFGRIQIYRITYVILNQEPTISLIYDGDILDEFVDYGSQVNQMGVSEFLALTQMSIIPKVLESKNDYLFAGNIEYGQDEYDKELEGLNFRSYSSGDWDNQDDVPRDLLNGDYSKARSYNKQYDAQLEYGKPKYNLDFWRSYDYGGISETLGGFGPIVQWQFITRRALINENNEVRLQTDNYNSIYTDTLASLRRGEVYRYGIVLYKNGGRKSSVKWIADIMVPDESYFPYPTQYYSALDETDTEKYGWLFNVIGIRFTVYTTTISDCTGYEIVRCKRTPEDCYTVSQGIIGIPDRSYKQDSMAAYNVKTEIIHPTGFFTTQQTGIPNENNSFSRADNKYLMFASPEYVYKPDAIKDIIKSNKSKLYIQDVQSFYNRDRYLGDFTIRTVDVEYTAHNVKNLNSIYKGLDDGREVLINNSHSQILYSDEENITRLGGHQMFTSMAPPEGSTVPAIDTRQNGIHETIINHVVAEKSLDLEKQSLKIKEFGFPEVPNPKEFFGEDGSGMFRDAQTAVGESIYNGWSAAFQLPAYSIGDRHRYEQYISSSRDYQYELRLVTYETVSSTGKCVVFELESEHNMYNGDKLVPITVADLKKQATPYGGPDTYDTNSPDYYSHGNYCSIDKDNPFDRIKSIAVFDGDCYPGVFVYHAAHAHDNSVTICLNKVTSIYYVPVESDIDLRASYGDLYTRRKDSAKSYYIQDEPYSIDGFVQSQPAYLYNSAYNAESNVQSYSSTTYTEIDSSKYDCRVHHSELKTNNEHVDSWMEFKAMNYIDVDTRFGEITNMRLFKDRLLCWQNNALSMLNVNERTMLNDQDDNQIILGSGAVLARYDYISTLYGMKKNQYEAEAQSNTTQYWWDGNNKEILAYAGGQDLIPMTKIKNVTNYINSYNEVYKPSLSYDVKFNELISNVVDKYPIIYNEQIQHFTSVYTFDPVYRTTVNDDLLLSPQKLIYRWNNESEDSTLFDMRATPLIRYIINKESSNNKTFDISTFGGRFYGGDNLDNLTFTFNTPLKQHSTGTGNSLITNREYDFRLDIPRNNNSSYGDRMRGKTMQCELKSSSNSTDFSLQYIITKYRMSWS